MNQRDKRNLRIRVHEGIVHLIHSIEKKDPVIFLLDGDLDQMSIQEGFLKSKGIRVGINGGRPGLFSEEDFKKSLKLIWQFKVKGWWNYFQRYISYSICTKEEFEKAKNILLQKIS